MVFAALLVSTATALAFHHEHGVTCPVNPELGVHGFPSCDQPGPVTDDLDAMQHSMVCNQRGTDGMIKIVSGFSVRGVLQAL